MPRIEHINKISSIKEHRDTYYGSREAIKRANDNRQYVTQIIINPPPGSGNPSLELSQVTDASYRELPGDAESGL